MACTLRVQVNLDGYALPIKKLKGTEPVESLDLSGKKLGVASTIVIASLISVNGSMTSLDLSNNELCGVTRWGGTYTAEGITAIADALRVTGGLTSFNLSGNNLTHYGRDMTGITELAAALGVNGALTSVELRGNMLGDKGWGAIFAAICGNKDSKIMSMDASSESIGPAGVKLIAEVLRTSVTGSLTELSIYGNCVGDEGVRAICEAIQSNKETKLASLNFQYNDIGPIGANAVAAMVAVTGSLTEMRYVTPKLERIWV